MPRLKIKVKRASEDKRCGTARLPRAVKLKIAKAVEKDLLQGEGQNNNAPDGSCEPSRGDFACYMDSNKAPQKKYSISLKERETEMRQDAIDRLNEIKRDIKYSDSCELKDTAMEYLQELEEQNGLENKLIQRHSVRDFWEEVNERMR